jgi:hypothetical protein
MSSGQRRAPQRAIDEARDVDGKVAITEALRGLLVPPLGPPLARLGGLVARIAIERSFASRRL